MHDEEITIGRNSVFVYHLFDRCPNLGIDYDFLIFDSLKLKVLLRDAVNYQDRIWFLFLEELNLTPFYDIFSAILDSGLSIQIVTL